MSSELTACKEELSKVQEEHERCLMEMQGNSHTQLARAQEEKAREKAELKDSLDRCSWIGALFSETYLKAVVLWRSFHQAEIVEIY